MCTVHERTGNPNPSAVAPTKSIRGGGKCTVMSILFFLSLLPGNPPNHLNIILEYPKKTL